MYDIPHTIPSRCASFWSSRRHLSVSIAVPDMSHSFGLFLPSNPPSKARSGWYHMGVSHWLRYPHVPGCFESSLPSLESLKFDVVIPWPDLIRSGWSLAWIPARDVPQPTHHTPGQTDIYACSKCNQTSINSSIYMYKSMGSLRLRVSKGKGTVWNHLV